MLTTRLGSCNVDTARYRWVHDAALPGIQQDAPIGSFTKGDRTILARLLVSVVIVTFRPVLVDPQLNEPTPISTPQRNLPSLPASTARPPGSRHQARRGERLRARCQARPRSVSLARDEEVEGRGEGQVWKGSDLGQVSPGRGFQFPRGNDAETLAILVFARNLLQQSGHRQGLRRRPCPLASTHLHRPEEEPHGRPARRRLLWNAQQGELRVGQGPTGRRGIGRRGQGDGEDQVDGRGGREGVYRAALR